MKSIRYINIIFLSLFVTGLHAFDFKKDDKIKLANDKFTELENSDNKYVDYHKKMMNEYVNNITKEEELKKLIITKRQQLFEISKPVQRSYQLLAVAKD